MHAMLSDPALSHLNYVVFVEAEPLEPLVILVSL